MGFFRKRYGAVIVTLVVVILATLLSVNRTLGKKSNEIADGFYGGVTYSGYEHKSIYSQLEQRVGAAAGLVTLGANYSELGEVTKALQEARNTLSDTMGGGDLLAISEANSALELASVAFVDAAGRVELSSRDLRGVEQYLSTLSGAQRVIAESGYNESVREFLRESMERFPASLLAPLAGVKTPVLFE